MNYLAIVLDGCEDMREMAWEFGMGIDRDKNGEYLLSRFEKGNLVFSCRGSEDAVRGFLRGMRYAKEHQNG